MINTYICISVYKTRFMPSNWNTSPEWPCRVEKLIAFAYQVEVSQMVAPKGQTRQKVTLWPSLPETVWAERIRDSFTRLSWASELCSKQMKDYHPRKLGFPGGCEWCGEHGIENQPIWRCLGVGWKWPSGECRGWEWTYIKRVIRTKDWKEKCTAELMSIWTDKDWEPIYPSWCPDAMGCSEIAIATSCSSHSTRTQFCSGVNPSPTEPICFSSKYRCKWNKDNPTSLASNWSKNGLVIKFEPIRTEERFFWGNSEKVFSYSFGRTSHTLFFSSFELGLSGNVIAEACG